MKYGLRHVRVEGHHHLVEGQLVEVLLPVDVQHLQSHGQDVAIALKQEYDVPLTNQRLWQKEEIIGELFEQVPVVNAMTCRDGGTNGRNAIVVLVVTAVGSFVLAFIDGMPNDVGTSDAAQVEKIGFELEHDFVESRCAETEASENVAHVLFEVITEEFVLVGLNKLLEQPSLSALGVVVKR